MSHQQQVRGQAHTHAERQQPWAGKAPFWVRYYDWVVNIITWGRTKAIHKETLTLANLQPGDAVLDIGCGTGLLLLEAEKIIGAKGTAVGLDVEPAMITQAKQHAAQNNSRAQFEVASIDHSPDADNSFAVILSTLMYHHLTEEQKPAGLRELRRVLKPDGRLLIVDLNPSRHSIASYLPGHNQLDRQDYVQDVITGQMRAAGFSEITAGPHPSRQLSYATGRK